MVSYSCPYSVVLFFLVPSSQLSRIESVFESESGFECASYLGAPCVFNLVFVVNHLALTVSLLSFVCFSRVRFAVYT